MPILEKICFFSLKFFYIFFLGFFKKILDFFSENFEIFSIFFSKIFLKPAETGKKRVFPVKGVGGSILKIRPTT